MKKKSKKKIPISEKQLVEIILKDYCKHKIPDTLKNKIRLDFKIRGNNFTLFEFKPSLFKPELWIDIPVAQFRYDPETSLWTLYCADRNSKWHIYFEARETKNFEELLAEVNADPTGIFWG